VRPEVLQKIRDSRKRGMVCEHVEEWEMDVHLLPLNGAGRTQVMECFAASDSDLDRGVRVFKIGPELVVKCACDEHGRALFVDGDIEVLEREAEGHVIARLTRRILAISDLGLDEDEEEEKGNASGATGNTETGTSSPHCSAEAAQ